MLSDNLESLQSCLTCPISSLPLLKAVSVVPCNHKIQESVAKYLFGPELIDGWEIPKGLVCPVCERAAKGYLIDDEIRKLAAIAFDPDYQEKKLNPEGIDLVDPLKLSVKKEPEAKAIPYPGKSATFYTETGWQEYTLYRSLCREIVFKTKNPDSLIQNFSLLGCKKRSVTIQLTFDLSNLKNITCFFEKTLTNAKLTPSEKEQGFYITKNTSDCKTIFDIVKAHNVFPKEFLTEIEEVVTTGKIFPKLSPVDYPGKSAVFIHTKGNWEPFTAREDLCRTIKFKSKTADSLIQEFMLLGYKQGDVRILLRFNPADTKKIQRYFEGLSDEIEFEAKTGAYKTKNKKDLTTVFEAIKAHNSFPQEFLTKMIEIVKKGKIESFAERIPFAPEPEDDDDSSCIQQ